MNNNNERIDAAQAAVNDSSALDAGRKTQLQALQNALLSFTQMQSLYCSGLMAGRTAAANNSNLQLLQQLGLQELQDRQRQQQCDLEQVQRNDNTAPEVRNTFPSSVARIEDNDTSTNKNGVRQASTIPCKARGMPADHNAQSAFFEIPEDVAHGHDLICSYQECRDAGVKFCYCSYCGVPVAKRNFRKRHEHAEEMQRVKMPSTKAPIMAPAAAPAAHVRPTTSVAFRTKDQKAQAPPQTIRFSEDRHGKTKRVASESEGVGSKNLAVTPQQQLKWASLLKNRPSSGDDDQMSSWLLKVLAVSKRDDSHNSESSGDCSGLTESPFEQETSTDELEAQEAPRDAKRDRRDAEDVDREGKHKRHKHDGHDRDERHKRNEARRSEDWGHCSGLSESALDQETSIEEGTPKERPEKRSRRHHRHHDSKKRHKKHRRSHSKIREKLSSKTETKGGLPETK